MRHDSDQDLDTEIEDQMAASGRKSVVPREGLVGAHTERRAGLGGGSEEPVGAGADVAPTRKAEVRERERHRLQQEAPADSRAALDQAAAEADRVVGERRLTAEATPARWIDRARLWMGGHHRQYTAAAAAGVALVGVGIYFAFRSR